MTATAPSGVVTFLFTDVEGSTRRWEADADGMCAALAAHDRVLRTAIESHGGLMFKHTGDGVCAAFASPRCAVDAAVAAQLQLELPVRMGMATGEAELRDGDYFGAVLNRAARVMAAGHGWANPAGRVDSGTAQRRRSHRSGTAPLAGSADPRFRCSRSKRRAYARTFRRCGRWMRVWGICGFRPPASSGASPNSTRASGGQGSSVGDVDQCRRGRQDAAGAGGRGAPHR